jgi:hypothetical protein
MVTICFIIVCAISLDLGYFWYNDYPLDDVQQDKIGFTIHGYLGFGGYGGAGPKSSPSSTPIKYYAFEWRWHPAKEWSVPHR